MSNFIEIQPSGDMTGVADTVAIQSAIDLLDRSGSTYSEGSVRLSGTYYLSAPIRIGGHSANAAIAPVSLVGVGHAKIVYVGPAIQDYAIRCFGVSWVAGEGLANLTVECSGRCRGVLVSGCRYIGNVRNLHVRKSVGVGLDALDCWATCFANIHIDQASGYGARFYRCNSSLISLIRIHGDAGNWPAANDTAAIDSQDRPYRSGERCGMLLDECSAMVIQSLICEGADYQEYPVVVLFGKRCVVERGHFELNDVSNCFFHVIGGRGWGRCNAIRGVTMSGPAKPECLVRFTRGTADNIIEQCPSSNLFRTAVAIQVGSSHSGNVVAMSHGTNPDVPDILADTVV